MKKKVCQVFVFIDYPVFFSYIKNMQTTVDSFLGGKVRLIQPAEGYRATSDSVLTAAAVPVRPGESVLDVGTGSGVVLLCLNARVPGLSLSGVEMQEALCSLARQNAVLNNAQLDLTQGDISAFLPNLHGRQFHHVVSNPPFYAEGRPRRNEQTAAAYHQQMPLAEWLGFCVRHVRAKGTFTFIHRPESLFDILRCLEDSPLGGIEIIPVYSKAENPAERILVRGKMGSKQKPVIKPPLVMHEKNGRPAQAAENILRFGAQIL